MGVVQKTQNRIARILLSDDDAAVRRSLQLLLRSNGYEVMAYTTGNALLLDANKRSGDCLIVDCSVSDIDGIAMLKRLRSSGWRGSAILITAYYADLLAISARDAGFVKVLEKPLNDQILLRTIARALSAHSVAGIGR